jgi:hypothetical protein
MAVGPARLLLVVAALASAVAVGACGEATTGTGDPSARSMGAEEDAGGALAPSDAGQPEATAYPAVAPDAPAVVSAGGAVLASPRIVPVFFSGETDEGALTDLITRYSASPVWTAAVSEYGIGAAKVAPAVHVTDPVPAALGSGELGAWIAAHLDGSHPEWGPHDDATIARSVYLLYPPPALTLYAPGQDPADPSAVTLCSRTWSLFGWHWQTTPAPGPAPAIAYAVVGRCAASGTPVLDGMTATTTHELVEAVTDPLFVTAPAWSTVDASHLLWMELTGGGELGDLCAFDSADLVTPPGVGHVVQRTWSNAAAGAGHDPCVPSIAQAYVNAVADAPDEFYDPYAGAKVHGVAIPRGQSRTVDVHLYSDAPTAPWRVTAVDPLATGGQEPTLDFTLDRATGGNGDVLRLTIHPRPALAARDTALYEIDSTLDGVTQRWFGEIVVTP